MRSADLMREARLRAGLTQDELGRRVGTTQSAIARWEAGSTRPPLEKLAEVVRACGLEMRVQLVDHDAHVSTLMERSLSLTPTERLDQLVRTVAFIGAARAALGERVG